jgi:uncharacterized protein
MREEDVVGIEVFGREVAQRITSVEELRQQVPPPGRLPSGKVIDHVDETAARFIAASPLAIIATRRADGGVDLTPRGDPPGFIRVLDSRTLAIPDRPGNNRLDNIENVILDGAIGLLFLIPGVDDTVRISGQAAVVRDLKLSEELAVNGRPAGLVTLVRVQRLLSHCPKAFMRSKAWHPEEWPDTADVPSLAEMIKAHCAIDDPLPDLETYIDHANRTTLY